MSDLVGNPEDRFSRVEAQMLSLSFRLASVLEFRNCVDSLALLL